MQTIRPVRYSGMILSALFFSILGLGTEAFAKCWKMPPGRSLEELSLMSTVKREESFAKQFMPAALLLSNGDPRDLKTAYGAGLILGWGQTGRRPDFQTVTGVGVSSLIAPFAFIGKQGDAVLAEIYNCKASNIKDMAQKAISYLTDEVVAEIARRHLKGKRLFIAIPGSPARSETIWDLGLIAASKHPHKVAIMGMLLNAAADHVTSIFPENIVVPAGKAVERNRTFLYEGAGNAFLLPRGVALSSKHIFVIENGVRESDLSRKYSVMRQKDQKEPLSKMALLTTYDLARKFSKSRQTVWYASINPERIFYRNTPFDLNYIRTLFMFSFRQGRMGLEWKENIVDIHRIKR